MNKAKISVIIPIYNTEKYIDECLNSIIKQSIGIENIEVIIVNDCTPDNSMDIINIYKEQYPNSFVIVENERNEGPGKSRNTGIDVATGEYVAFVDSDDFLDSDVFEYGITKMEQNNVELFLYQIEYFKELTGDIFTKKITDDNYMHNEFVIKNKNILQYFNLIFETSSCNKIYKKELLQSDVQFSEERKFEDMYFSLFYIFKADIFVSNKVKYHYRKRATENSTTDLSFKSVKSYNDQIDELLYVKGMIKEYPKLEPIFGWFLLYSWTTFLHHLLLGELMLTQQEKSMFYGKTRDLWQDIDIKHSYSKYIEKHHKKLYEFIYECDNFDEVQQKYKKNIWMYKLHTKFFNLV